MITTDNPELPEICIDLKRRVVAQKSIPMAISGLYEDLYITDDDDTVVSTYYLTAGSCGIVQFVAVKENGFINGFNIKPVISDILEDGVFLLGCKDNLEMLSPVIRISDKEAFVFKNQLPIPMYSGSIDMFAF